LTTTTSTTTITTANTISPSSLFNSNANDVTTKSHGINFWRQQPFKTTSSALLLQQKQHHHQHQHQRLQYRYFIFDSRKVRKTKKTKNPFKVLKIPKESLYKDVKKKFLKIAMSNHPDTYHQNKDGGLESEKEREAMRDKFIEARMAFELLTEDPSDGTAILVEEKKDAESNFDSWFHNETGLKNPFDVNIDPETMKEVAEMTEKLGGSQGMDRDGGSKLTIRGYYY